MKRTINVLWTGGLDSSCRIAELSQYDIIVQPYYMLDKGRKSIKQELKAIKSISRIIRNNPKTRCELKDPIITDINNVKKNSVITNAWKYIHDKYSLGIQYDWLARFAEQYNIQLEIGLEKNPRGKAFHVIDNECFLVEQDMDGIIDYAIDSKRSNKEATILFQNLLMPKTIWHMTKLEEAERVELEKKLHQKSKLTGVQLFKKQAELFKDDEDAEDLKEEQEQEKKEREKEEGNTGPDKDQVMEGVIDKKEEEDVKEITEGLKDVKINEDLFKEDANLDELDDIADDDDKKEDDKKEDEKEEK
jgi:hypothetical protein